MNWIKLAGDNLPQEGSTVLCYWPNLTVEGRTVYSFEIGTAVFEDGVFRNPDNEDDPYYEPSHWMALPSPPTVSVPHE